MREDNKITGKHNILYYSLSCFVIVMIVISLIGGYLYYYLYKNIYSDFINENERYLSVIKSRHEKDMQIIDNIISQIEFGDSITKFGLVGNPQKVKELKGHLRGYTAASNFFEQLFYTWHEDNYLYNYSSSFERQFFLERCTLGEYTSESFERLMMEEVAELRILPEQTVSGTLIKSYLEKSDEYSIIFRAIPPKFDETLIFFVPSAYYDELLAGEEADMRLNFLYYNDKIIVSRGSLDIDDEALTKMMSREIFKTCAAGNNIKGQRVSVGNVEYIISIQSDKKGILYGSLQSMEVFENRIRLEQIIVLMLFGVCVFSTLLPLFLISRGVVSKVKKINNLLQGQESYELKSIEEGILVLISSRSEIEKEKIALNKMQFIKNFVRGDFSDREEAVAKAADVQLQIDYKKYVILLFKMNKMSDEKAIFLSIVNIVEKNDFVGGYGVNLINNNKILFVLFGDSDEILWGILQQIQDIIKCHSSDSIMAVSNIHTDFTNGADAYLESESAFDSRLLLDNSKIICFEELVRKEYVNPLSENYIQQLKHIIRVKDKDTVKKVVSDICNEISEETVSLYTFRIFYHNMMNMLLAEWKGDKEDINKFFNVFSVSQCKNKKDFHDLICNMCETIIDKFSDNVKDDSDIVGKAISYMKENFEDSYLNMNAVAEYLGVSPTRLAAEFKKQIDVRPLDYLTNLRMDKAKMLLCSTNINIQEISRAVGYEDVHVFIRWFKKYTGTTPGRYREGN